MDIKATAQAGSELQVSEIFYSIQGESSFAGFPCVFVRLAGCNLRCNYCDAAYTWEAGEVMEIDAILSAVDAHPCELVEVTGGEPLFQGNTHELLERLLARGKKVLLESNGSMDIAPLPDQVTAILDVKCPDSGSAESFHPANVGEIKHRLQRQAGSVELKFVLSSEDDYKWAKEFIAQHGLTGLLPILFSPVQQRLSPRDLARWLMEDGLGVRLQLQLHTILWPDVSRGV